RPTRSPRLGAGAVPRARRGARASYPTPAGTAHSRHAEHSQPAGPRRGIRRTALGLHPEWRVRAQASAVTRLGASISLRAVAWTGGIRRGPGRQFRVLRFENRPESDHHPSIVAPALGHPNGPVALGVGWRSQGGERAPETRPYRSLRRNRGEALAAHDPGRPARRTDESLGKEIPMTMHPTDYLVHRHLRRGARPPGTPRPWSDPPWTHDRYSIGHDRLVVLAIQDRVAVRQQRGADPPLFPDMLGAVRSAHAHRSGHPRSCRGSRHGENESAPGVHPSLQRAPRRLRYQPPKAARSKTLPYDDHPGLSQTRAHHV